MDQPDLLPACSALAAAANGVSTVSGMQPLAASGSLIVDPAGVPWRITGTSLGGFQTVLQLDGSWNFPYRSIVVGGTTLTGIVDRLAAAGFNCVRLLICEDVCYPGAKPLAYVNPTLNPDWFVDPSDTSTVLDAVQILDLVVAYCGRLGLRVVFDMHALAPDGNNAVATNGLWYTTASRLAPPSPVTHSASDTRNEADWLNAWVALAQRYVGNPIVIGADLVNEPWAASWGDGNLETDIQAAYTRCANATHAVNPAWLVFCEGICQTLDFGAQNGGWVGVGWGAGLAAAGSCPVTPDQPDRVVYSPHEYGPGIGGWNYFNAPTYPDNLPAVWGQMYGYLAEAGIAPLWIGEVGDMLVSGANNGAETPALYAKALQWIGRLLPYAEAAGLSWSWFCWSTNGYSGTPGSIINTNLLMGDYNTPNTNVLATLTPFLAPLMLADIPIEAGITLNAPAAGPVTVAWHTRDGSAVAGTHYRAGSGQVSFTPGQTQAFVTVLVVALSRAPGASLYFFVAVHQPSGCAIADPRARVTIGYA